MNTLEAIEKRWGCKKYISKEIDREVLTKVLNAGRFAPSAGNLQDRSFILIKNPSARAEIAKASGNQSWMQEASVHVIITAENRKNEKFFGERGEKVYSIQDTAFAAENMLLAAVELGIGASLVVGFNEELITNLLEIKPPAKPYAIIVLGYSAEKPQTTSKYPLETFVYYEKYGSKVEPVYGIERDEIEKTAAIAAESIKKESASFFEKIKNFFKRKPKPIITEDHFLGEKIAVKSKEPKSREEIPRQIPRQ